MQAKSDRASRLAKHGWLAAAVNHQAVINYKDEDREEEEEDESHTATPPLCNSSQPVSDRWQCAN